MPNASWFCYNDLVTTKKLKEHQLGYLTVFYGRQDTAGGVIPTLASSTGSDQLIIGGGVVRYCQSTRLYSLFFDKIKAICFCNMTTFILGFGE